MNIIYTDHLFFRNYSFKQKIKENAIPSIFSWVEQSQHSLARAGRAKSRGIKRKLAEEFSSLSSVDEVIFTSSDNLQVSEEIVSSSTQILADEIQVPVQKSDNFIMYRHKLLNTHYVYQQFYKR